MDFTPDAKWRSTVLSNSQYLKESSHSLSPFCKIEGHRKELCWRDWAHLDPLGFGRDLGAGLLKSMVLRKEIGEGTVAEQLRTILGEMNEFRKKNGKQRISGVLTPANTGMDNMSTTVNLDLYTC